MFLALVGASVRELQTHFFLYKSKLFEVQLFSFTLEAVSVIGPTLVWERTRCYCSLIYFFFSLLFFMCNITPAWNLTGFLFVAFFFHFSHSETQWGDWGQVDKLTFIFFVAKQIFQMLNLKPTILTPPKMNEYTLNICIYLTVFAF